MNVKNMMKKCKEKFITYLITFILEFLWAIYGIVMLILTGANIYFIIGLFLASFFSGIFLILAINSFKNYKTFKNIYIDEILINSFKKIINSLSVENEVFPEFSEGDKE